MLVPGALGIGLCNRDAELARQQAPRGRTSRDACRAPPARSRASAARSARSGATASLQRFGEGTAYGSAALALVGAAVLTTRLHVATEDGVAEAPERRNATRRTEIVRN